jgi:hypothetical protein
LHSFFPIMVADIIAGLYLSAGMHRSCKDTLHK